MIKKVDSPNFFLKEMKEKASLDQKPLRFCHERLSSMIRTLELTDLEGLINLEKIANFATLVGTYQDGFCLIFEAPEKSSQNEFVYHLRFFFFFLFSFFFFIFHFSFFIFFFFFFIYFL